MLTHDFFKHTEKLLYFYEVALDQNMHKASRRLGLSTPTLSYSIKQLEEVLGVQLFLRSRSGMQLTESGQSLFVFCKKFFSDLSEIETLVQNPKQKKKTRIRVGTFQSIAIYFWPLLLKIVKNQPHLSLSITTNRSHQIYELLVKKEIDVALTVESPQQAGIIRHELYHDHYSFYVSKKLKKRKLNLHDLRSQTLLFIPDARDHHGKNLKQYTHGWNLQFEEEFELDSFEVIASFVAKNYGIGILPNKVGKAYTRQIEKIKLEDLPLDFGKHIFYLSYRDDLDLPQSIMSLFLQSSKKVVMELNE